MVPTFIILTAAIVVVVVLRRRSQLDTARYGLGALATRLGFQMTEGSPDANLVHVPLHQLLFRRIDIPFVRGPWIGLSARMIGSVRGRSATVRVRDQHAFKRGFFGRTLYTNFDGHIAVEVRTPFPLFEVISRTQHAMMSPESKLTAPLASFDDPQLDAALILRTTDRQIVPVIREAMRSMLAVHWVCVRGEEGRIVFDCVPTTKTMLFDSAEPVLTSLAYTAEAIEAAVAAYHAQQAQVAA